MPCTPGTKLAVGRNLSWRVGIVKFQVILDGIIPVQLPQSCFMYIEAEGFAVPLFWLELNEAAVGHEFIHDNVRVLRLERLLTAEWRNENVRAVGNYPRNMSPEDPHIAALHPELLNLNQLEMIFAVVELDPVQHASRREVRWMVALRGDGAVAGFFQIL